MKKTDAPEKTRKTAAFILSVLIHGALLWFIVQTTLDLALPEGNVSVTEVEFSTAEAPLGTQVDTPNVGQKQNEVPEMAAPVPIEAQVVAPPPQDAVEDVAEKPNLAPPKGDLPVKKKQKVAKKAKKSVSSPVPEKMNEDIDKEIEDVERANDEKITSDLSEKSDVSQDQEKVEPEKIEQAQLEAQTAAAPEPFGVPTGVRRESQIRALPGNVPPKYSVYARLRRWEGTTSLRFMINKSGSVDWVKVTKSSGYSGLDDAAKEAYLKYRYQPGQEGEVIADVVFRLTGPTSQMPSELRRRK